MRKKPWYTQSSPLNQIQPPEVSLVVSVFWLRRVIRITHTHCSRNNVLIMQMPAGGANRRGHPSGTMGIGFEYVAVLLASAVAIAGVSRGKGGSILQEWFQTNLLWLLYHFQRDLCNYRLYRCYWFGVPSQPQNDWDDWTLRWNHFGQKTISQSWSQTGNPFQTAHVYHVWFFFLDFELTHHLGL